MEKLLLIDGNSLFNRAFFATPPSFTNSEGTPTNAIYGFTTMLFKAFTDIAPSRIAVAFDLRAPTFRHKLYDQYKGTRKGMPPELAVQVPLIKEMLSAMGILTLELAGYEADDILGTVATRYEGETIILTGDNDYLQLISDSTTIYITKKGLSELNIMDETALMDARGLTPSQIIDLKALMGDSSDNIPGVRGIGEKTATTLLEKYVTLDGVYSNIEELKGKMKEKLVEDKEMAYLSYTLATIDTATPIDFNIDDAIFKFPFSSAVVDLFKEFSFNSLLKRSEFFGDDLVETVAVPKLQSVNHIITSASDLTKIIQDNRTEAICAVDLESGTFAYDINNGYTVAIAETLLDQGIAYDDFFGAMCELLSSNQAVCLYDIKALKHKFAKYDVEIINAEYDLMLLNYIVDFTPSISSLPALLNFNELGDFNSACGMLYLLEKFKTELVEQEVSDLYYNIERPLVDVLYSMERDGFSVDTTEIDRLRGVYQNEIAGLTDTIHRLAGEEFNINSPKQLGHILFDVLELKPSKKTKTGLSTNAETLEKLLDKHEIIPHILRFRQISKLLSTYIEGMSNQIDDTTHKIHTVFNQALTVTGRLSSKEPNLQNIPVRQPEGRLLRKLFVPSSSDNLLISADYSQIELRLLAHFSHDVLLEKSYQEDLDIHAMTASQVFGVDLSDVTSEMRSAAKAVNFGIIYGISDFGLAKQIGVANKTASEYIAKYFQKYASVHDYMDKNVEFCRANGYVNTITGRRRKIAEINSKNFMTRSFGERAAMNMPLQGSAADIIKIAMINVFNRLNKEKLQSKLILQIHDELLIDTLKSEKEQVEILLREEMENAVTLSIPMTVNVACGESWYEAK